MDTLLVVSIIGILFTALLGLLGYSLSRNVTQHDELIKDLYAKRKDDADKLVHLELMVVRDYHPKGEVQELFKNFKSYLDEKFGELRNGLDCCRNNDSCPKR